MNTMNTPKKQAQPEKMLGSEHFISEEPKLMQHASQALLTQEISPFLPTEKASIVQRIEQEQHLLRTSASDVKERLVRTRKE